MNTGIVLKGKRSVRSRTDTGIALKSTRYLLNLS